MTAKHLVVLSRLPSSQALLFHSPLTLLEERMIMLTLKKDVAVSFSSYLTIGDIVYDADRHYVGFNSHEDPIERVVTNLAAYGLFPQADTVFIKDWSEHQGVTQSLVDAGLAEIVREVFVGPYETRAYELRIIVPATAVSFYDDDDFTDAGAVLSTASSAV